MRAFVAFAALLVLDVLHAQSEPVLSSIVSAADNSLAAFGVARGSIFTIYGRNLAVTTEVAEGAPLPITLGGTRVRFLGTRLDAQAPLLYVSPSQINAIVPAEVGTGTRSGSVETAAGAGSFSMAVVETHFTAFTTSGRPFGPAIIQQYDPSGIALNRFLNPALAGDALVLWGTGLGLEKREDVVVYIGMIPVKPVYAGPAPGLPGVAQINLTVPEGLVSRCFQPFVVRAGGRNSPVYTLSTGANRGACSPEIALTESTLANLDRGWTVGVAVLTIQSNTAGGEERRAAEAWVGEYDAAYLSLLVTYDWGDVSPVACSGSSYTFDRNQGITPPPLGFPSELYGIRHAGATAAISGPGNCRWVFSSMRDGVSRASAPDGCPAQNYSITWRSTASGEITPPKPAPTDTQVSFKRQDSAGAVAVSWTNPGGSRLTIDLSSSFTLPGNIFSGRTDVRKMSCWLSGYSGTGEIPASDVDWALGLPSGSASFRSSLAGLQSWGDASSTLLIRTVQSFQGALAVR